MYLPPVPEDRGECEWRLNDGARVTTLTAHVDRADRAMLQPAFAWSAGLWRGYERIRELTFEALEQMPLLLFDPGTGRLVATRHVVVTHAKSGFRVTPRTCTRLIHFAGIRYYARHGLARDSVTVRIVDDQIRIYYRGSLISSHERRHPKEKEEVIRSHHRQQKNGSVL